MLTRHLKEAIQINKERMPRYAALSGGKTLPYSKRLIRYEKLALCFSWYFDRVGRRYQEQGLPYLESEFVEMSLLEDFSPKYPATVNHQRPLEIIVLKPFSKKMKSLLKEKNFEEVVHCCNEFLEELEKQIHVYCMLRHVVESIRRIAFLVPVHEQKALTLGIKPPTIYTWWLLKSHCWVLAESKRLDEAVAPIQQAGLPFLFQDLPSIEIS